MLTALSTVILSHFHIFPMLCC